jgi:hypothetical protein
MIGLFELLSIIVALNVVATIALWRQAVRHPEQLKKKFLNQLWRGKPITPKHQPPAPLKPDAWGVGAHDLRFFTDFKDFANVVNWWFADEDLGRRAPWRLQELPDPELTLGDVEGGPRYGRRYAVFHNQVRVGILELEAANRDYSTQNPRVATHIELEWARLLAFGVIRDFFEVIALHTCDLCPLSPEYFDAHLRIDRAMMHLLWQTQEVPDPGGGFVALAPGHGEIEVQFNGLAECYIRYKEAPLRKSQTDKPPR